MADVINQRFGISARSKSSYKTAFNEEILLDKTTGEFLIKTPDGNLISYDYNNRLHMVHNDIENILFNVNMFGDLYTIPTPILPISGTASTMVVDSYAPGSDLRFEPTKKILFHISIDQIKLSTKSSTIFEHEDRPNVFISYICTDTSGTRFEETLSDTPENINNKLITFNNEITSLAVDRCMISYLYPEYQNVLNIVNYLGVVVER